MAAGTNLTPSPDNKRPSMKTYKTDAEIARSANKLPIAEVAAAYRDLLAR